MNCFCVCVYLIVGSFNNEKKVFFWLDWRLFGINQQRWDWRLEKIGGTFCSYWILSIYTWFKFQRNTLPSILSKLKQNFVIEVSRYELYTGGTKMKWVLCILVFFSHKNNKQSVENSREEKKTILQAFFCLQTAWIFFS